MFVSRGSTSLLASLDKVDPFHVIKGIMEKGEHARVVLVWINGRGEKRLYIEFESGRPVGCIYDDASTGELLYGEECFRKVVDSKLLESGSGYIEVLRLHPSAVEIDREYVGNAFVEKEPEFFIEYVRGGAREKEKREAAKETTPKPTEITALEKIRTGEEAVASHGLADFLSKIGLELHLDSDVVCDPLSIASLLLKRPLNTIILRNIEFPEFCSRVKSLLEKHREIYLSFTATGMRVRVYIVDGVVRSLSLETDDGVSYCNDEVLTVISRYVKKGTRIGVGKIFVYR